MVPEAGSLAMYQWSPEKFSFRKPEEWTKWIQCFKQFSQTSGLNSRSKESQVNALIYTMGDKADNILHSFHLSEEDSKNYNTVKEISSRSKMFFTKEASLLKSSETRRVSREFHN